MDRKQDITPAHKFSAEAMDRIRREGLSPIPHNYELWYVYFANQNPDVTRAIDILLANDQKITEERCEELYQRFLSKSRNDEKIRSAGSAIDVTIRDVAGAVRHVKDAARDYSGTLESLSVRLSGVEDAQDIVSLLDLVAADTAQMILKNKVLEDQLDKSTLAMDELRRDLEHIRREAVTDGLTGLSNRKAFDEELQRVAADSRAQDKPFTLIMVDIDHFKNFNDNFGHQVGDQVLRLVARAMIDGVKGQDVAARYGGEEFAIILPGTDLKAGVAVSENLRRAIATKDVINRATGEKLGRITMSAGVAEFCAEDTLETLIARTDAALYTAKHNGRNQVAAAPTPRRGVGVAG